MCNYVQFPDFILDKWKNGKITHTHMTDLLRLELLVKYGGMWVDATVLCTSKREEIPDYFFNSELFLYQILKPGRDGQAQPISSWLMSAKTNNKILMMARYLCYEYWKKKITALQEKSGTLCLRQWADKPYRSPQESILEVPANMCIVQPLILRRNGLNFTAEVEGHPVKLEDLARNDGLTPSEFAAWFIPVFDKAQENALTFAIIQFTTFRY